MTRSVRSVLGKQAALGYALVVPLVLVILGLLVYPVFRAILLSFQDKMMGSPGKFIGLDNYVELFTDDARYFTVVRNSFFFT